LPCKIQILHFADALKEECSRLQIRHICNPLLSSPPEVQFYEEDIGDAPYEDIDGNYSFVIPQQFSEWIKDNAKSAYRQGEEHNFYVDMREFSDQDRHAELWQYWGTEFRRKLFSENYWVDRLAEKIATSDADIILIPDTRFKNEVQLVKELGGYTLEVVKYIYKNGNGTIGVKVMYDTSENLWVGKTEDGKLWVSENPKITQFIAPDRDPNHPSEIDLDGVPFDFKIGAFEGDLAKLHEEGEKALLKIIAKEYFK